MDSSTEFEVVIDFLPSAGDPGRVFRAMADLIASFEELDRHLVASIDSAVAADLVLEKVGAGSIKAIFKSLISDLPDEALKNADWKKIIGHYLLKSKYLILQWCGERDVIESRQDVRVLEEQLLVAAKETDVKLLPAYAPVPSTQLLADIRAIQQSLEFLLGGDKATYRSHFGSVELNGNLVLSNDLVLEVLTREVVESNGIRIVQVKKPDYLGRSQWSFRYDGHKIDAAIHDKEWLGRFQSRLVDVQPGDSLKVDMREKIYYGYDGEIVHRHYAINGVIDVIKPVSWSQVNLF